jgi:outer membrane receptor protein involved in Fe transport
MRLQHRLLASTFLCGTLFAGTAPAHAQDQKPETQPPGAATPAVPANAEAQAPEAAAIVITGSRIPQPNLTSVSPVTVINSAEIRLEGTTRTEDLVNNLPQVTASQAGNLSNGATGAATVNLRNLGANRTLVLIDGRRMVPGDPTTSAADLNFVPATLIERVDVLTGGASSVYGADAVAGVVNFIMNTNFEGIRIDSQYSFYQHDNRDTILTSGLNARGFGFPRGSVADGGTTALSAQIGASFDDGRGHVVAYGTYRKMDPVTQDKRDYSSCVAQAQNTSNVPICGGSLTAANATIFAFQNGTSTIFQVGPNRTLTKNLQRFNFAPTNYYQRPDERYSLGFFANYEISESLRPYMEGMFMDDRTVAQIAPSGDFGNTFAINCDNPLLGASQKAVLCATGNLLTTPDLRGVTPGTVTKPDATDCATRGQIACTTPFTFIDPITGRPYNKGFAQILRRNIEGGPRVSDIEHSDFRIVTGMRGDLGKAWSYDGYFQYGRTNFSLISTNDFSITRLRNALDVVTSPTTGQPVCRSALSGADPVCVPYDVFGNGTVSQAAVNYLSTPGFQRSVNGETVANLSFTGKLGEYGIQLPWAQNGVGVALGAEYRKESLDFQSDAAFSLLPASDLAGVGAAILPVKGAFDVRELFGEIRVPIVENGIFQNLSLEAGYRHSSYNIIGTASKFSTSTYKIGGDFAPVRDIRFRASYNRAVRAPNIQELFAPQVTALDGNTDPCSGHAITAGAADAGCRAQGLRVGQFVPGNPSGQYNGLLGGVATLQPEIADTYTAGVVLQPRFIPRLAITVDYYNIKIRNAIQKVGADVILNVCAQTVNPTFCGLVHRDTSGSIWRSADGFVTDLNRNIGGFATRGIDIGAAYSMGLGRLGNLSFNATGTYLISLITNTGVSAPYDCAGFYGLVCSGGGTLSGPNPKWRHKMRVTWNGPDGIGLSLQWRYLEHVAVDVSSTQSALTGPFSPFIAKIPSQSYFDLALTARLGDHYNFRLGVNNLFDKPPPIIGSNGTTSQINACPGVFCNGNTFPGTYDALGRYVFAGVTLDF